VSAFEYTALDSDGKKHQGMLEGDGSRQVRQQIRSQGLIPLEVTEISKREKSSGRTSKLFMRGIKASELALLTRQFATLVEASLPVEEALTAVAQQTERPQIKKMLLAVRSRVTEGHDLATALAEFPRIFSDLYLATVSAGEQAGHLPLVLDRLADYTENHQALKQTVQLALIYPVVIIVVAVAMVTGLLTYVVPQVVQVFQDIGQELPALTQVMIESSDFLRDYGLVIFLLLAFVIIGVRLMLRRHSIRVTYHKILLKLPLLSRLVRGVNAARFSRTLSIMVDSGVPMLDALRISGKVVTNLPMREAVDTATRLVGEGVTLHRALDSSGYFPPMTIHLIASGESSGTLDTMLNRAALSQERDLDATIQALLGVLSPLIILVMGGMVLLIVLGMLLPIMTMNDLLI